MTSTRPEPAPVQGAPETVVVVGASGFIGQNFVRYLQGKVGRIVPVSASGRDVAGIAGVRSAALDEADIGHDSIIVNLAAYRYDPADFARAQPRIFARNVEIASRIYEFCAARGISEVRAASSNAVYPADDTAFDDAVPLDLNRDPHDGELMYAWSKRITELMGRLFARKCGVHTLAFRLTNPYGPFDSIEEDKAHVLPAFVIRALTTSGPFTIRGNAAASRDFVYVGDVCEVLWRSFAWRERDDAYNLGSGENTTIRELARTILRLVGDPDRPIVSGAAGAAGGAGVAARSCRTGRLRTDFGIDRFTSLGQGLRPTIEWYRDALRL